MGQGVCVHGIWHMHALCMYLWCYLCTWEQCTCILCVCGRRDQPHSVMTMPYVSHSSNCSLSMMGQIVYFMGFYPMWKHAWQLCACCTLTGASLRNQPNALQDWLLITVHKNIKVCRFGLCTTLTTTYAGHYTWLCVTQHVCSLCIRMP